MEYSNQPQDVFEITELHENNLEQICKLENHNNTEHYIKSNLEESLSSIVVPDSKAILDVNSVNIKIEPLLEEENSKANNTAQDYSFEIFNVVTKNTNSDDAIEKVQASQILSEITKEISMSTETGLHIKEEHEENFDSNMEKVESLICPELSENKNMKKENERNLAESNEDCIISEETININIKPDYQSDDNIDYENAKTVTAIQLNHNESVDNKNPLKKCKGELQIINFSSENDEISKRLRFQEIIKFVCQECGECADTLEINLKHFEKNHTSGIRNPVPFRKYKCGICGELRAQEDEIKSHIISAHAGDEIFTCDQCNERFYVKEDFYIHRKEHNALNLHKCEICGKKFANKSSFNVHSLNMHTAGRPFKCVFCYHTYKDKRALLQHERIKHFKDAEKGLTCLICSKLFLRTRSLLTHMKKFHNLNYLNPQSNVNTN